MATHPADLTPAALTDALCLALPEADAGQLAVLAEALLVASRGNLPPEAAQAVLQEHGALLRELGGREIQSGSARLSFEGAQLGDVSIGDVAGRDVIKVSLAQTIVSAEQAYNVAGLPNPYPGLRPFTYTDRARFAGRERLVSAALAQLTIPGQEHALLFVTGASGCGKSSFAQAGLLPALEAYYRDRALTVRHAVMRPSRQPLAALADALRQVGVAADGPFAAAAPFALGAPVGEPPDVAALLIDQYEELFTQSEPDQRDGLLELLAALPAFRDVRVHILCTLRSDFLGELAERRALAPVFRQQVLLWAMDKDELREAILRPIQQAYPDKRIEPALLDRLVADVSGEAGYLPLLQVTLEDLWRRGSMTLGDYSSLTDAIRDRAEQVYAFQDYDSARRLPRTEAERALILSLLLDLVEVSLDDESRRDVRQRRSQADLTRGESERTRLVVDLASARLLSTGVELRDDVQVEVVDIVHESLIANWDRLKLAIAEQRATLQRRARFEAAVRAWLVHGKPDNYLLDGGRLAEAQLLDERADVALTNHQGRALLTRSLAKREEQRRRQLRQTQMIAAAFGLLALLAFLAAGFALQQQHLAENRARVALGRQVLLRAEQDRLTHPDRAVLLRLEASRLLGEPARATTLGLLNILAGDPRLFAVLRGQVRSDHNVRFSPDGRFLLSSGDDTDLRVWDVASGTLSQRYRFPHSPPAVAFNREGQLGFVVGDALLTLDLQARAVVSRTSLEPRETHVLAGYTPGNNPLLTTFENERLHLEELVDGQLRVLVGDIEGGYFTSRVTIGPNGEVALITSEGALQVWNLEEGRLAFPPLALPECSERMAVSISVAASLIATSCDSSAITLYSLTTGEGAGLLTRDDTVIVDRLVFSPDGSTLIAQLRDEQIELWDVLSGAQTMDPIRIQAGVVLDIAVSPGGDMLAVALNDGTTRLYRLGSAAELGQLSLFPEPDDSSLRVEGAEPGLWLTPRGEDEWTLVRTEPPEELGVFQLRIGESRAPRVVISPDLALLAIKQDDNSIQLYDVKTQQPLGTRLSDPTNNLFSIVFSNDSTYLAVSDYMGFIYLWDLASGALVGGEALGKLETSFVNLQFRDDGKVLAAGGNRLVILYDTGSSQVIAEQLGAHEDYVTALAFSRDGSSLATASTDRMIKIWRVTKELELAQVFESTTGDIISVAFSADGALIATGSNDNRVRVWSTLDTSKLVELTTSEETMVSFDVSDALQARDEMGTRQVRWPADRDYWVKVACSFTDRNLTVSEWVYNIGDDEPYNRTCSDTPEVLETPVMNVN